MAEWHFGMTGNWYANLGPYVGFLLSAHDNTYNYDLKSGFNSADGGLAGGIGVKIPLSNNLKLFFELNGQDGIVDIIKNDQSGDNILNARSAINIGLNF